MKTPQRKIICEGIILYRIIPYVTTGPYSSTWLPAWFDYGHTITRITKESFEVILDNETCARSFTCLNKTADKIRNICMHTDDDAATLLLKMWADSERRMYP